MAATYRTNRTDGRVAKKITDTAVAAVQQQVDELAEKMAAVETAVNSLQETAEQLQQTVKQNHSELTAAIESINEQISALLEGNETSGEQG